jgi:hypothetical protein
MEDKERLEYKLRVEQIKKNLIEFRYRNIHYLKQAVDKIRDSFLKKFEIEKPMPYSMIEDVINIYRDDKRYGENLDLSKRIKEARKCPQLTVE